MLQAIAMHAPPSIIAVNTGSHAVSVIRRCSFTMGPMRIDGASQSARNAEGLRPRGCDRRPPRSRLASEMERPGPKAIRERNQRARMSFAMPAGVAGMVLLTPSVVRERASMAGAAAPCVTLVLALITGFVPV